MQHPDEGTIHAWLDGALSAADAGALEAHVATCATCAAAVSEARGLLAASSRILSALDSVPGGVLPIEPPAEVGGGSRVTVRQSSVWRSPGWRAAAAILVVGTVSWLATRPGGPSDVATQRAETPPRVALVRPESRSDTTAAAVPEPRVEQHPAAERARRRVTAPSAAPRSVQGGEAPEVPTVAPHVADAERKVAPPQRVGVVVAAPPASAAMADAAPKVRDSAVTAEVTSARIGAMGNRAAASAGAGVVVEQRSAAPSPTVMMQGAMAPMARAIAPASAIDVVGRLAGCYTLEAAWTASEERSQAAAALLPARVELTRDRDASADPSTLVLHPAPREPAFATGTRGGWTPLGGNTIELWVRDGAANRVSAILSVAGDSLSGEARAYTGESAAPLVTSVKGRRVSCSSR